MPSKTNNLPEGMECLLPLTPAVFFILFALVDGEKHGYAIMQDVLTLSEDKFRMAPGHSIRRFSGCSNLSVIEETTGSGAASDHEARRRYYRLTRSGKALLETEIGRMESVWRRARRKKLRARTAE